VRVRDRDHVGVLRPVLGERQAVPEQPLDLQRALADRERWVEPDADEARLDLLDPEPVVLTQLVERRPPLAAVADVLALVEADRARGRRLVGGRVLRPARGAEERRYALTSSFSFANSAMTFWAMCDGTSS
jgi:hypothetical protein